MRVERKFSDLELGSTPKARSKSNGKMRFKDLKGAHSQQPPAGFFQKIAGSFHGSFNSKSKGSSSEEFSSDSLERVISFNSDLSETEARILSEIQNASPPSLEATLEKILKGNERQCVSRAMRAYSKLQTITSDYCHALTQICQKEEWIPFCSDHFSISNDFHNSLLQDLCISNSPQQLESLILLYFPYDIKREHLDDTFLRNSCVSSRLLVHLTQSHLKSELLEWCQQNPKPTPDEFIQWLSSEKTPNKKMFHDYVRNLRLHPLRTYLNTQEVDVDHFCRIAVADLVFLRTINPIIFQSPQTEEIKSCFKELQREANNTTLGIETLLSSYLDFLLTPSTASI